MQAQPGTTNASGPLPGVEYVRCGVGATNYLVALTGSGEPALLLHGFPQTHYCWRKVIPTLAARSTIVAPDLRGYGGSRADPGGPRGEGFTKRELGDELVELMRVLGYERFDVVGHDRGARVAYRMALDHADRVRRLAIVNVIPTIDQFRRMTDGLSLGYWPWFLLAQPAPFPEQLLTAAPRHILRFIFDSWPEDSTAIDDQAFGIYHDALTAEAVAAICGDFRASFWLDQEHEQADREAGRQIACPTLVVTGAAEKQLSDAGDVWRRWAGDLRTETVPGGHFLPEEASEELAALLAGFLSR